MDKYSSIVTKNKFNLKKPPMVHGERLKEEYKILEISYDKFPEFISYCSSNKNNLPKLDLHIYDEDIIINRENSALRYSFLQLINQLNIKNIKLYLSDSTMPIYNQIMSKINWKYQDVTKIYMSIDRNPVQLSGRKLHLASAKGTLMLDEGKLVWISDVELRRIADKIDNRILHDAWKLKDVIVKFYDYLNKNYYIDKLSDFDKVVLVYDTLFRLKSDWLISYAHEGTTTNKDGILEPIRTPEYEWIKNPYGTYIHKKGVCEGQAKLMSILLNNYYLKIDAKELGGYYHEIGHSWVGTVIDDKLYQTCTTMSGPLRPLDRMGYKISDSEQYLKLYPYASLQDSEVENSRNKIKRLKK